MGKAGKKANDSAKPKKNVAKVAKLPKDLRDERDEVLGLNSDEEEEEVAMELLQLRSIPTTGLSIFFV